MNIWQEKIIILLFVLSFRWTLVTIEIVLVFFLFLEGDDMYWLSFKLKQLLIFFLNQYLTDNLFIQHVCLHSVCQCYIPFDFLALYAWVIFFVCSIHYTVSKRPHNHLPFENSNKHCRGSRSRGRYINLAKASARIAVKGTESLS